MESCLLLGLHTHHSSIKWSIVYLAGLVQFTAHSHRKVSDTQNLARGEGVGVLASIASSGADLLRLYLFVSFCMKETTLIKDHAYLRAIGNTLVLGADSLGVGNTGVALDGGSVAHVAVDSDEGAGSADSSDALDGDVTLVHLVAVSAGAVQLAEVVHSEAGDADGAAAVVLDNLVLGALRTTTDDGEGTVASLEGEGVYR